MKMKNGIDRSYVDWDLMPIFNPSIFQFLNLSILKSFSSSVNLPTQEMVRVI